MPMTPEERKAYDKEYYKKNKEKIKEQTKEYYEQKKEKIKEWCKEWREENQEKLKEQQKEHQQTASGKKSNRINSWKQSGLKCDDIPSLYEHYINCKKCEVCDVELVEGNKLPNRRCMDHDHKTGLFRNVLCHGCNVRRK